MTYTLRDSAQKQGKDCENRHAAKHETFHSVVQVGMVGVVSFVAHMFKIKSG